MVDTQDGHEGRSRVGGTDPPPEPSGTRSALPTTPAAIVVTDSRLAVADLAGNVLFRPWPDGDGTVVRAHQDRGPLAVVGTDVATAGGWDPTVALWDPRSGRRRWTHRIFDGRVTGLYGRSGGLLVSGADRLQAAADAGTDRSALARGRVVELGSDGEARGTRAHAGGQVHELVAGAGWFAFLDVAQRRQLRLFVDDAEVPWTVSSGVASALATDGRRLLAAMDDGVYATDVQEGATTLVTERSADDLAVLQLAAVGDAVFAATSEGLVRWPGGLVFARGRMQPVAISTRAASLLVLWPDGLLEERDASGAVLLSTTIPSVG